MSKKGFTTTNLHSDRLDKPEHGVLHKAIHTSVLTATTTRGNLLRYFKASAPATITGDN